MALKSLSNLMIIRRNGKEMKYDRNKIINAIGKANAEFSNPDDRLSDDQIEAIVDKIENHLLELPYICGVEDIQDQVIYGISEKVE
jgi:ribonucleoside-triphosphate reductase